MTISRRAKQYGIAAAAAVAAFTGWIYLSPYWDMAALVRAAVEKDTLAAAKYINTETLRESARANVLGDLLESPDLGTVFGAMMADRTIDAIASPAGVMNIVRNNFKLAAEGEPPPGRLKIALKIMQTKAIYHDGLSLVHVGDHKYYLTFQRSGLTWKLAAITMD